MKPRALTAGWYDEDDADHGPERISTSEDCFEHGAALEGLEIGFKSRSFRKARVTAVLSGVTLDFREAALNPDGATIEVQSALSGIDLLVPRDWEVVYDLNTVYSGVHEDRRSSSPPERAPRLRMTGTIVAGGVRVR